MEWLQDDANDDLSYTENHAEREWNRLSEAFTNDGYREGITAGKEGALQEGFDDGFANRGVPVGRKIGTLRGLAHALLLCLRQQSPSSSNIGFSIPLDERQPLVEEIQFIVSKLSQVQLSDVVSPDMQAEEHNAAHMQEKIQASGSSGGMESDQGGDLDALGDAFGLMSTVDSLASRTRHREESLAMLQQLEDRLAVCLKRIGLHIVPV